MTEKESSFEDLETSVVNVDDGAEFAEDFVRNPAAMVEPVPS